MSDEPTRTEHHLATELNHLAAQDRAAQVTYMRLVLVELEAGRVEDAIASIRTWIETIAAIDRRSP